MTRTKYILKRVVGSWRLFWGFCPECNSVDERRHTCTVCNGHRGSDNEMLKTWKQKYKTKLIDTRVLYLTNKELGLN